MDETRSTRGTGFVLTDDNRSPIQILGLVEPLVFCEGIDGYVRLSPRFEVCQTLVKRGPVSGTLVFDQNLPYGSE